MIGCSSSEETVVEWDLDLAEVDHLPQYPDVSLPADPVERYPDTTYRKPTRTLPRLWISEATVAPEAGESEAVADDPGMAAPLGAPETATAQAAPVGLEQWAATIGACIRRYESGGNYGAVNPSGKYRGAYQFDIRTWQSVGGVGDPATASKHEQDLRAYLLWQSRGLQPWPTPSRRCR